MATLLLVVIYLAFISLGLPDTLLGVTWPLMHPDFGLPLEAAGIASMTIAGGTIVSSLMSGFVLKRVGTGKVALISTAMTAGALLGISFAPSFVWLLVLAIPLGLGAGSIDAGLNHYVATHYRSHHMSWLHCFWGVGATIGPNIMARYIAVQHSWRQGYLVVSLLQFALVAVLLVSLPLWGKVRHRPLSPEAAEEKAAPPCPVSRPLRIKGVKAALLTFLFYCGIEGTVGLWGSTYLIGARGITADVAARWISLFFGGITLGRLITGFVTFKVGNPMLIRAGQLTSLLGVLLLLLPLPAGFSLAGLILLGLGCAPVFPCMIQETPVRFGAANAASIIGFQMAFAYSSTFLPPLLGVLIARTDVHIFPYFVLAYIGITLIGAERINWLMGRRAA